MSNHELENDKQRGYHKLDLQFFAEKDGEGDGSDGGRHDESKGVNEDFTGGATGKEGAEVSDNADGQDDDDAKDKDRVFTQEEVNAFVQERLARERRKQEKAKEQERDEAERKRLEEQEEYKELAEKLQRQLDEQKADALDAKKRTKLVSEGYSDEQVELLIKLVDGESDEDISESIEKVKKTMPAAKKNYVDPSEGNGRKSTPDKKGAADVGSNAWDRIKDRIRR